MINFMEYCGETWANLDKYVNQKYIIDNGKNHFVRNRKTNLESTIKYPFYDCGQTTYIKAINFIRKEKMDKNTTLTKSNISQRRKLLDYVCYVDMTEDFIDGIYNDPERPGLYRRYSILAGDTSICDAPNIRYTNRFHANGNNNQQQKNRRSRTRNATFRQLKPKNRHDKHHHNLRQRIRRP